MIAYGENIKVFCGNSNPEFAKTICKELGITLDEVCFVGDDVNDLDLLQQAGTAACPANAVEVVKAVPGIIHLTKRGGDGAIRELCEMILAAKNNAEQL